MNKNPQVKEGSLKFLNRCLSTSPTAVPSSQLKSITDPIATLLEDGFAGARDEAASVLGTLMKMVGERPLNALMDSLADVRKVKVKEAYEKATVKCKSAPPKAVPAAAKAPPAKKPTGKKAVVPVAVEEEPEVPKKPTAKPPAVSARCLVILTSFSMTLFVRPKSLQPRSLRSYPPLPLLPSQLRGERYRHLVAWTRSSTSTHPRMPKHLLRNLFLPILPQIWRTLTGRLV